MLFPLKKVNWIKYIEPSKKLKQLINENDNELNQIKDDEVKKINCFIN